jgi:hypothetical protein
VKRSPGSRVIADIAVIGFGEIPKRQRGIDIVQKEATVKPI